MQSCVAAWADPTQETHHSHLESVLTGFLCDVLSVGVPVGRKVGN
jgi:hypothetical protein